MEEAFTLIIKNNGLPVRYPSSSDYYHIDCVQDYIYEFYKESDLWKIQDRTKINLLLDFLNSLGEIVYLHSPGYGLLFMPKPEDLTDEQTHTLYEMFKGIERTPFYINEFNNSSMFIYNEALNNTDVLDEYFKGGKAYEKRLEQ